MIAQTRRLLALVRPKDWIKNGFVFVPLFFTPPAVSGENIAALFGLFVAFSLVASSIYVLNDWRDRNTDRLHPTKCHRPIVSGAVSPRAALICGVSCLLVGLIIALVFAPAAFSYLAAYAVLNVAYCLLLKNIALLDVFCIAAGFVLRVMAGAAVIEAVPSPWIIIMTGLLALFLAFAKRRDDLSRDLDAQHRPSLSGYTRPFLDVAIGLVLSALLIGYLVYTTDDMVAARFGTMHLYATAPFVVYGLLRYCQLTLVTNASGSPTDLVFRDRPLQLAILGWLVTFGLLIYG